MSCGKSLLFSDVMGMSSDSREAARHSFAVSEWYSKKSMCSTCNSILFSYSFELTIYLLTSN